MKKPPVKKTQTVQLRVTEYDKNRIRLLADRYAAGDMTAWVLYGALNVTRKRLK